MIAMEGIELMATAMQAAKRRLDVSAANLANVSSDGFQKRVARESLTSGGLVTSSRVDAEQGPLRHTGRNFDLAVVGSGGFFVRDRAGRLTQSRSGSFDRNALGQLADERGRVLMGRLAPIRASGEASIDSRGIVRESGREVGRVRLSSGTTIESEFIESSNVDAVGEMVDVLAAQRSFETAQKTLSALDDEREKEANDVVRVKS